MPTHHAFDFLDADDGSAPPRVCVAFGDESFLKRLVMERIRHALFADDDTPFATFDGAQVEWRDVADELSTASLFGGGGPRLVVVEDADPFVTRHRERLEAYVERPARTGVLVMTVSAWPSNTRLYKAIDKSGLQIDCRAPQKARGRSTALDAPRVVRWLKQRGEVEHNVQLSEAAASLLLDLVGPEFGMLDQDLAKLALYAGPGGRVTPESVRDQIGGWKTTTIWELIDAAADGNAAFALEQLHHLLAGGEAPQALFGQISWSLRRYAIAGRICRQDAERGRKVDLAAALLKAGFRKWPPEALSRAESQMRQLGRDRIGSIHRWLLEADLAMKGSHSQDDRARFVLEQLILRLSKDAMARRPS